MFLSFMKIFEKVNNFKKPVMTAFSKIKKYLNNQAPLRKSMNFKKHLINRITKFITRNFFNTT